MKVKYYKQDDILVIKLNDEPVDYAEESNLIVINFSKKREPVSIEIIDASRFFNPLSKALPKELKQSFFASV